jgi:hypothetical protein
MAQTSPNAIWNAEMLISTCAITSKRIGQSSYWKQMTNAGAINAQHPKNMGAIIRTIKERPSMFEKTGRMV